MTLETIPASPEPVAMSVDARLVHQCPVVAETDRGRVMVSWFTQGATLELHALAAYLDGFADVTISHEDLTDRIRHDLEGVAGIAGIRVATSWTTAGMAVVCTSGRVA